MEFRLFEQFLSHENQGHPRCGEGKNGGQGAFSPRDQTQRGILVGIGYQASFLIKASGFVVVFRVDHAAESEIRLHPRGDLGDVGLAWWPQQLGDHARFAIVPPVVEVVLPRPVEAVVADCILGNADLVRVFGAEHSGYLVDQFFALRIFHGA